MKRKHLYVVNLVSHNKTANNYYKNIFKNVIIFFGILNLRKITYIVNTNTKSRTIETVMFYSRSLVG